MSLHSYYSDLDFKRITQARERKGMTKKKLAELIGKKASAVTQFESGKSGIAFETFQRLVEALEIPPAYLTHRVVNSPEIPLGQCHFRANRNVSMSERTKAKRYAEDILGVYAALERRGIEFPEIAFSQLDGEQLSEPQMEAYSAQVRAELGLGLGPIPNMADLIESVGIRIVLLPTECAKLDAFACWVEGVPCIMVAGNSPSSRLQFDYAHEFKHLLCDEDEIPDDPLLERAANRFASSFLMPKQTFLSDCPSRFSIDVFISLKSHWSVSIKAALYRARQLGVISERTFTNAYISLSKKGYSKEEPGEEFLEAPYPQLLGQALDLLAGEITLAEIADELALSEEHLEGLLSEQGVPQTILRKLSPPAPVRRKGILRLVK
jgi:Predicted Zn peptidase